MLRVAILMTSHNRRLTTLACIDRCMHAIEDMKIAGEYSFEIFLVDDGSTDYTAESVKNNYPSVNIIRGDGNLFWNRGMRLAWEEAAKGDFDFYLWLNDDTIMDDKALHTLTENSKFLRHRAIVVGTTTNTDGEYTYGGRTRHNRIVVPDPVIPVPCYMFNGNIVLVPKHVYRILGNLEPRYHHSFGDYDYGVRAGKANVPCVVAPGVLGVCSRNPGVPKWRNANYPLKVRYAAFMSPKGRPPREQFLFDSRWANVFFATGHYVSLILKMLFPLSRRRGTV